MESKRRPRNLNRNRIIIRVWVLSIFGFVLYAVHCATSVQPRCMFGAVCAFARAKTEWLAQKLTKALLYARNSEIFRFECAIFEAIVNSLNTRFNPSQ